MKKFLLSIPLILSLAACDNIKEDDRYIEIGDISVERRVLLEEFTGQRCTNCPAAHAIIERLEEQYGDDLIVVSIHAGSFGIAAPNGLMQKEGDEYANHWNITAYPEGVVDRLGSSLGADAWAAAIRDEAGKETPVQLDLQAGLWPDGKIDITTEILSSADLDGALQLWIVENDIVGFQIDGDNRIPDYVHNNVFRACVNGLWGQDLKLKANVLESVSNTIEFDETWNIENLSVVGFYYNTGSGVIQVNRCNVKVFLTEDNL